MNKNKNFFITTPIYYTNWIPHIWHAYSTLIADVLFRYNKEKWIQSKFSTWVDENSQKVVEKAKEKWITTQKYTDIMAKKHKAVWKWLNISYTDFIRTTDSKHKTLVQKVLQKTFDNWDIYEWIYKWLYCVWCEWYKKETDLISSDWKYEDLWIKKWEKVCPDHANKHISHLEEKNYFFRLSKYQKKLEEFYEKNPNFIFPSNKKNEVLAFIKSGLEDFSISREWSVFWIELPFDKKQVTYVWYDALFNYRTVCEWWDEKFWPPVHIVWKDITRFHAIYWPAMLMSVWYELPKKIIVTWYFTVDWEKISKSLWNAIDPVEFSTKYSRDVLVLYLLYSLKIWSDWDFNQVNAIKLYNDLLANNFWNLVNRIKVLSGKIPLKLKTGTPLVSSFEKEKEEENISKTSSKKKISNYILLDWKPNIDLFEDKIWNYNKAMQDYKIKEALEQIFSLLDILNKYMNNKAPWLLLKDKNKHTEVKNILTTVATWIHLTTKALSPFFPDKMKELSENIKFTEKWILVNLDAWILFQKFELEAE